MTIVDVFVFHYTVARRAEAASHLLRKPRPGAQLAGGQCCSLNEHSTDVLGAAGLALTGPGQGRELPELPPALRLAPGLGLPGEASQMMGHPKEPTKGFAETSLSRVSARHNWTTS